MVKKYKKADNISYTLGSTLTVELLLKKVEVVTKVYFHSDFEDGDTKDLIIKLCDDHNIEIITSNKVFNILSDKENCYVIGEFLKYNSNLDHNANHLLLVNPSNNGNLGTIIRSAVGFNLLNIGIITPSVDIFNPQVVRSSMGSLFHLNFEYFDSYDKYHEKYSKIKEASRKVYPFMLKGKTHLQDVKNKTGYTLVFGNEATGLRDDYLNYGEAILIPHEKRIDSLNLPVAVSIALYEFTKEKY